MHVEKRIKRVNLQREATRREGLLDLTHVNRIVRIHVMRFRVMRFQVYGTLEFSLSSLPVQVVKQQAISLP